MNKTDNKVQACRQLIRENYRQSDDEAVARLLPLINMQPESQVRAMKKAEELTRKIRKEQFRKSRVDV